MTLTEYLNQKDPVRMPDVVLAEGEYVKGATIQVPGQKALTLVYINAYPGVTYIMQGDSGKLYTTDRDCNVESISCFRI